MKRTDTLAEISRLYGLEENVKILYKALKEKESWTKEDEAVFKTLNNLVHIASIEVE